MSKKFSTNALVLPEIISNDAGRKFIKINEVTFDAAKVHDYIEKFNNLFMQGYAEKGEFESNEWYLLNNKEDLSRSKFLFPFETKPEWQLALKAFVTILIYYNRSSTQSIYNNFRFITEFVHRSSFFSEKNISNAVDWLKEIRINNNGKTPRTIVAGKSTLLKLVFFCNPQTKEQYIKVIENGIIGKCQGSPRDLPYFKDLIEFNEIIRDFFSCKDKETLYLREKYKPIEFWWKVTTIIPMRVGELVRLKTDCATYDATSGKYYLKIPRIKRNTEIDGRFLNTTEYELQNLEVTKDIYDLVVSCINLHANPHERFLFNHKTRIKYYTNSNVISSTKKTYISTDALGSGRLNNLLKSFQEEVVTGIYNIDLVRKRYYRIPKHTTDDCIAIQLGDTRHIAIGNLIEQGVNPLVISYLCYHNSVNSQDNYCNYIVKQAEVKAEFLASKLVSEYNKASRILDSNLDEVRDAKLNAEKAKYATKASHYMRVKEGICRSEYGIFSCPEKHCLMCMHLIPIINRDNVSQMRTLVEQHRNDIYKKLGILQTTIHTLLEQISKDSIKLEDGHFTGNKKSVEDLQAQYNESIELKNQLAKVEAVNLLINEYNNKMSGTEGDGIFAK